MCEENRVPQDIGRVIARMLEDVRNKRARQSGIDLAELIG